MTLEELAACERLPEGEDPFAWFSAPMVVMERKENAETELGSDGGGSSSGGGDSHKQMDLF